MWGLMRGIRFQFLVNQGPNDDFVIRYNLVQILNERTEFQMIHSDQNKEKSLN